VVGEWCVHSLAPWDLQSDRSVVPADDPFYYERQGAIKFFTKAVNILQLRWRLSPADVSLIREYVDCLQDVSPNFLVQYMMAIGYGILVSCAHLIIKTVASPPSPALLAHSRVTPFYYIKHRYYM
jgi:hypothetical protein